MWYGLSFLAVLCGGGISISAGLGSVTGFGFGRGGVAPCKRMHYPLFFKGSPALVVIRLVYLGGWDHLDVRSA